MPRWVKKSEFAQEAGVTAPRVSQAIKNGELGACLRHDGKRIDANHYEAVDFLEKAARNREAKRRGGVKPKASKKPKPPKITPVIPDPEPPPPPPDTEPVPRILPKPAAPAEVQAVVQDLPADIRELIDEPFRRIIELFGTDKRMLDWLKATLQIDKIHETRLKNEEKEGKLVRRDLVYEGVIVPFDTCHIKLMTDGAKAIAKSVAIMALGGKTDEERELYVRDQLATYIKKAKDAALTALGVEDEE